MKLELGKKILTTQSIALQTITQNQTINGTGVDRRQYRSAVVLFGLGSDVAATGVTARAVTCTVTESDDNSTFTAISSLSAVVITNTISTKRINIDLNGVKRYIRPNITAGYSGSGGGSTNSASVYSVVILDSSLALPVSVPTSQTT